MRRNKNIFKIKVLSWDILSIWPWWWRAQDLVPCVGSITFHWFVGTRMLGGDAVRWSAGWSLHYPIDSAQISTFHHCWWELVNGEGYRGIIQPKMLTEMPTTASELFRVFSEIFDQLCSIYTHNIYFPHTLDNTRSWSWIHTVYLAT